MAAKKFQVEFVVRYEDRDKDGNKLVIPAGTKAEMTKDEIEKAGSKVRIVGQGWNESGTADAAGSNGEQAGGD